MHFNRTPVKRSEGRSAVAVASYTSATPMTDHRLGHTFNYQANVSHVGYSNILAPENTPIEFYDREMLWNAVEASEKRKDAAVSESFNAGLPLELNNEQQVALIDDFCESHYVSRGIICGVDLHDKKENPHFHCQMTTRPVDDSTPTKFSTKKTRAWFKIGTIAEDRIAYCEAINKHLKMAGSEVRYDHRTLEAQGIDRVAQIHVGPTGSEIQRKHEEAKQEAEAMGVVVSLPPESDRFIENQNIINFNNAAARIKAKKEAEAIAKREADKKAKAKADASAKINNQLNMLDSYNDLTVNVGVEWDARKDWFIMKPVKPIIETIDNSKLKRNLSLWKQAGQEIRNVIHKTIDAIRGLTDSYKTECGRDIKPDAFALLKYKESKLKTGTDDMDAGDLSGP